MFENLRHKYPQTPQQQPAPPASRTIADRHAERSGTNSPTPQQLRDAKQGGAK